MPRQQREKRSKAEMKSLFMVIVALVFFSLLAFQVSAGIGDALENVLYDMNNFFSSNQYQDYAQIIDFAIFFILFTSACYMGLHKWAGDKTPHGAVVGIAVSLGLAMAIPLVLYTKASVALLFPFAKAFLFMIIVWLIWNVLVKGGMSKWKAFLLALLLTFLMFLLAGYLLSDGTGGGLGGIFSTSFGRVDLSSSGLPDVSSPSLPGVGVKKEPCEIYGIFTVNKASLADISEGEKDPATWAKNNCEGSISIEGYASMEGPESRNTPLSEERANAVKAAISTGISAKGKGSTLDFTPKSPERDELEKRLQANPMDVDYSKDEPYLRPNRRYVLKCTCGASSAGGTTPLGGTIPPTSPGGTPGSSGPPDTADECEKLAKQIDDIMKAIKEAEDKRDAAHTVGNLDDVKKYGEEASKGYSDIGPLSEEYQKKCTKL